MKFFISLISFLAPGISAFSQNDFVGIVKYKLSVIGSDDKNTDSMKVIFDKERVMIVLYLPDSGTVDEKIFIDDLKEKISYQVDSRKKTYKADSLKTARSFEFVNTNSIGAAENELCFRYAAKLTEQDRANINSAECLGAINYRNSTISDYFFLGVQPLIVDNRIVFDYTVKKPNGTRPNTSMVSVQQMDNVDKFFDLWGYKEIK